jgi:aromatic-L-amino-acid decarboxylase
MVNQESLTLSPEEMRTLGYRVVDMLVQHMSELHEMPVTDTAGRATLEARLREPLPQQGSDALDVLDQLEQDVFSTIMHSDHPRFFAFVPSPGNFIGVLADALASGFNIFAGTWLEGSGPAQVELVTVDWLRQACGLPEAAGGLFVSGGSMANITALAVARHVKLGEQMEGAMVYGSDQTHSSVARGLRVLGFHRDQLRYIQTDDHFRLDLAALERAVEHDRAVGRVPFCVVANAGTTNTGAIDPLPALVAFCHRHDLWLHVDGAYGAASVLCERGKLLLEGLGEVDSLSLDPHKWLFQPFEIGCALVRDEHWLVDTFRVLPEYLQDVEAKKGEVNFCDRGIQLTRGFRALKLWMSLKVFGGAQFEAALNHGFQLAEEAEAAVRELPHWEVVTPAQMAIVTFRFAPPGLSDADLDRLNRQLVDAIIADRFAMLSSTVLRGRTVLRMCTINPRTTPEYIRETLSRLATMGRQLLDPQSIPGSTSGDIVG